MGLLDLLFVVAAILVIIWLVGLIAFSLGPLLYALLVIALIVIIIRFALGRRV